MKIEIPEFKRCCFCLPLRYGLLVWSYLLLILLAKYAVEYVMIATHITNYHFKEHAVEAILYTVACILLFVNIVLTILFIVAAHKKNVRMLKVYYKFALYTTIASFTGEILWMANMIANNSIETVSAAVWKHTILSLFFEIVTFGIKLYVLRLVRSEILKLEKINKFQFSNIAAEAENAYYEPNKNTIQLETDPEKTETNESVVKKSDDEDVRNSIVYIDSQVKGEV